MIKRVFAMVFLLAILPVHARCKHPWLTDKYTTEDGKIHEAHECWLSDDWYPQSANEFADFMYREKHNIPFGVERPVNHWMISFKFISGISGDCGEGKYRIIMRNSTPVPMEPKYRYEVLTEYSGDCGGDVWGASIREDDTNTVKLPPYDFEKEEQWIP